MPCAAPVMIAIRSRRRMGAPRNTPAFGRSTGATLLPPRFPLDLVLELFDRDRMVAVQERRDERGRKLDRDLAGVVHAMRLRRWAVLVGRVEARIERPESIERAVRHHRNVLLCDR